MWIWLTISIILVTGCIIFGIYSFISTRALQRSIFDSGYSNNNNYMQSMLMKNGRAVPQQQAIINLITKFKSVEENLMLSTHQINELQKKVKALESTADITTNTENEIWDDSDEDWEKLFYETRREKQSLEENLVSVKEVMLENMNKLQELESQQSEWVVVKSDLEAKTNEVEFLQNSIEELRNKLTGAREREEELHQQIVSEKLKNIEYDILQKQNIQLQSNAEILTKNLEEINERNILKTKNKNFIDPGIRFEFQINEWINE